MYVTLFGLSTGNVLEILDFLFKIDHPQCYTSSNPYTSGLACTGFCQLYSYVESAKLWDGRGDYGVVSVHLRLLLT